MIKYIPGDFMKKNKLLFVLLISLLSSCNNIPSESISCDEVSSELSEDISGEQVELNVINEDTFRLYSINLQR